MKNAAKEYQNEPKPNITIKNFTNNQLNRFELTIPVVNTKEDILHFLALMQAELKYKVEVTCHIFHNKDAILVYYWFNVGNTRVALIEIELKTMDFNIISLFDNKADKYLKGFNSSKSINVSKFQMIGELND